MSNLLAHEAALRLTIYATILCGMLLWEHLSAAYPQEAKAKRWVANLSLAWFSTLCLKIGFPLGAVALASFAEHERIGLLHNAPLALNIIVSLLALDLVIYWQHRLFHAYTPLWRLHSTHHLDAELDASTGGRFHPFEYMLSMLIKMLAVFSLGCAPVAVLMFEIILNASATFNHSNVRLPKKLKAVLQPWLITPEIHRIHHSTKLEQMNSNFGFCLVWWDKLFQSFTRPESKGAQVTSIGIRGQNGRKNQSLVKLLIFPFKYKP